MNRRVLSDLFSMPHYCHICGRRRANERFSGRGHRDHVCKECMRLPSEKRRQIEELDETTGFLTQSNISEKNLKRLALLVESADEEVAQLAKVVREIAEIRPRKRRRLKVLAKEHRNLFLRLEELGLLEIMRPY